MEESKQPRPWDPIEEASRMLRTGSGEAASAAARILGARGGQARVARQSAAERSASARNAAQVRWMNAKQREASRA